MDHITHGDSTRASVEHPRHIRMAKQQRKRVAKITHALEARRGNLAVIVYKIDARGLASGAVSLPDDSVRLVVGRYVRAHFEKVYETRHFEVYK